VQEAVFHDLPHPCVRLGADLAEAGTAAARRALVTPVDALHAGHLLPSTAVDILTEVSTSVNMRR